MYKESRLINGIYRILNVIFFIAFSIGEILIYAMAAPTEAYTYTDFNGQLITFPSKPFQFDDFIGYSFALIAILFVAYLVIAYIIDGFRTKDQNIE